MISKTTIDKVFEQSLVEEVVGEFVQLKKSGSNYKGLSPFSNEKTPSFVVSPVKQIWKDFSSGKGGNAVAFLMEHEHFTYPEAIKYLARKYNIEIEETQVSSLDKEKASEKESLFIVSEYAKDFFSNTLLNSDEGKTLGLSYFKERGFSDSTLQAFDLGYSPEAWDALLKSALKQGFSQEIIEKIIPNNSSDNIIFFLDAHWGEYWPVLDELRIIKEKGIKPVIIIHDFYVPDVNGNPKFGFDKYKNQNLDFNYVKPGMDLIYGNDYVHYCIEESDIGSGVGVFVPKKQ